MRDFATLSSRLNEPLLVLEMTAAERKKAKPVFHLTIAAAKEPDTGELIDRYLTDEQWAGIAGEYAGLGAVQRARGIPPYLETQNYVRRMRALIASYAGPAGTVPGGGPPGSWRRPVTGPMTSGFGPRWGWLHAGVDFAAPIGTPVSAAATAPSPPPDLPVATANGSRSPTPAASAPSTGTSAAGSPPSAKPSRPASSSPTAATKAAPPECTCTSRLT